MAPGCLGRIPESCGRGKVTAGPSLIRSQHDVPVVVPEADHGLLARMIVAEHAERRRAQQEQPAVGNRQAQPSRRQHAEEVAVTEQDRPALDGAEPGDDAIGSRATSSTDSPPGAPSRNRSQSGRILRISAVVSPSNWP